MLHFTKTPRKIATNQRASELGFGRKMLTDGRMMNADGSFNVERETMGIWDNTYHYLITMSWGNFFLLALCCYVLINSIFAVLYCIIGIEHLGGVTPGGLFHNFINAYFFSSQTLTTVGYGHISPDGLPAGIMASLESFAGLLAFALVSGLMYGRFSRPQAKIVFSENMLIAPYNSGQALMFRMGHASKSELIETEVQVLIAMNQRDESGDMARNYYPLQLEINKISFFSLSWTLVHALDEKSPIFGFSEQDILDANAEVMVLVKGLDDTNQQMVHARRSYTTHEFIWNARFGPIIGRNNKGRARVFMGNVGKFEMLETPPS